MPDFEVEGNPGNIRSRAVTMEQKGQLFYDTGDALAKIDVSGWTGRAAEEFREAHDLEPASSGVRAQALHPDGRLADDFEFSRSNGGRVLHVLNAPSPAATASLVIGEQIARELLAAS